MAKGYWIVHVTVTDPDNYPKYMEAAGKAIADGGGTYIVRGGESETREGELKARHVVIEFESYDKARACYESPAYQSAQKLRAAYAQSDLVIVEGNPAL